MSVPVEGAGWITLLAWQGGGTQTDIGPFFLLSNIYLCMADIQLGKCFW